MYFTLSKTKINYGNWLQKNLLLFKIKNKMGALIKVTKFGFDLFINREWLVRLELDFHQSKTDKFK